MTRDEDPIPCLIVDCTESHEWPGMWSTAVMQRLKNNEPQRVPEKRRPTILQPDRKTAEIEAQRLALANPDRRFVIFEACAAACTAKIPTHTTVSGKPWGERTVAILLDIGEDDWIPF